MWEDILCLIISLSPLSTYGNPTAFLQSNNHSSPQSNFEIQRIPISIHPVATFPPRANDFRKSEIGIVVGHNEEYESSDARIVYARGTIDKLVVQEHITRRDLERSKNATWSTYFAEILAALILLTGIIIFICWWNCTKRGGPLRTDGQIGLKPNLYARRGSGAASRRNSLMEIPVGSTPLKPMKPLKCPKTACVCPSGPGNVPKGKRKWNYKEDNESYAPSQNV